MRKFLALLSTIALVGCATHRQPNQNAPVAVRAPAKITYYDRNHDGRVDYEYHDFGCCDRNWALVDTDFNGRYDLELKWGYGFQRKQADFPVATGVSISPEDPPEPRM